ncbi:MAG: radical SAM protein [Elusimicrobia bacterium]|nr:radical SAM protein [Elusimicrobiota bacterium]
MAAYLNTGLRLTPGIHLRREYFGGLVFDPRNGNILEVDRSAFEFLRLIEDRSLRASDATTFLDELLRLKIIEESEEPLLSSRAPAPKELIAANNKPWLTAPETVHWAVTYRCQETCPDCYVRRFSCVKNELNTCQALEVIDKIADWGVFQLAIGGGEPFLRKDLPQLVSHAAGRGLSVHVTTGKLDISHRLLESIAPHVKNLQIGIRADGLAVSDHTASIFRLKALLAAARGLGMGLGANLFLTKSVVRQLRNLIKILIDCGFDRIVLLRYKPPAGIERWKSENPDPHETRKLHEQVNSIAKKNPQLDFRVDCALGFIQRDLPAELAKKFGIKGCVAADRILALAPDGCVYPCSQLVHPPYNAGNLLESEPESLWNQSPILRKYRFFRAKKTFVHSWCGVCQAKYKCGGCRVFSRDGLGADTGCPAPVIPALSQIGKIGRSLNLTEYMRSHLAISVGEYMDRYGVGQQKAIKELNACPDVVSKTGKSARRKTDTYHCAKDDIVLDIQKSIGFTCGGFPFASYEQISKWIESPS